jgi:hypothetical protein
VDHECWFFRSDQEWIAIAERLKQTPCPHCHVVGTLIRHGCLSGCDDSSPPRQTRRAQRVFCSNRHRRRGCGRTFSVWLAHKIRRLSLSTRRLWCFLQHAVTGSIAAAVRIVDCHLSHRTFQRIWQRFLLSQSHIRTALLQRCSPPDLPAPSWCSAAAHVLAHLQAAFANVDCPITSFQHTMRRFFV